MSEVHHRIMASAEELYAAALDAIDSEPLWWVEMSAAASTGACRFLINDLETEEDLRAGAANLRRQAMALSEKARSAWVGEQLHARLNGVRPDVERRKPSGDMERLMRFMDEAVQRTLGG